MGWLCVSRHPSLGLAVAAAMLVPAAAQARTTSHAMTTAGEAYHDSASYSCRTSSGDPIVAKAFTSGMGLPTEGYAYCNLSGSQIDNIAAGATSATSTASRAYNNGIGNFAAAAVADYDHIGASSSGTFTGYTSGLAYHSAEGAAIIDDTLAFTGGSGIAYVRFGFTVDGSLRASMGSEAQAFLAFTAPGNSPQFAFAATIDSGGNARVGAGYTPGFSGFGYDGTTLSGSGVAYTYGIGFTFGTAFDFEYGLRSYAYAAPFTGDAASGFLATAKLTSISVTDSLGQPVDFAVTSASGTLYDANGAHVVAGPGPGPGAVPEPAAWATMLGGFALIGGVLRRRRAVVAAG